MAFTTTTALGGQGSHMMPPFYADFLRENLYGRLYLRQLAPVVTIPRGNGTKARISKFQTAVKVDATGQAVLTGVLSAIGNLAEATAPTPIALSASSITGEVTAFEGAVGYTDKMVITSMANFSLGALETLSHELSFRIDRWVRRKISGGALKHNAILATGVANAATKVQSTSDLFGKNVARIKPVMESFSLPTWMDNTYVGVGHPIIQYDITKDISATGFVSVVRYNDAIRVFRGELGTLYGIRWLLSNAIPRVFGSAANSATFGLSPGVTGSNSYIFSPNAFYTLELDTGGVEVIHQPLGSSGAVSDPTAKLGSIGCKLNFGVIATPSGERRILRFVHSTSLSL